MIRLLRSVAIALCAFYAVPLLSVPEVPAPVDAERLNLAKQRRTVRLPEYDPEFLRPNYNIYKMPKQTAVQSSAMNDANAALGLLQKVMDMGEKLVAAQEKNILKSKPETEMNDANAALGLLQKVMDMGEKLVAAQERNFLTSKPEAKKEKGLAAELLDDAFGEVRELLKTVLKQGTKTATILGALYFAYYLWRGSLGSGAGSCPGLPVNPTKPASMAQADAFMTWLFPSWV